jgi:hypothetical protein
MNLEDYYKRFNFPAASTFLKLLKNEGLKYTKDEVDKFIKGKTEQQQTTIKTEKRKDLGKIVSYYPLSLIQMDIFDLAKYYKENQGYKYILCIVDVYSRKVWAYKMKNKDNINVFESFKQFIKDSNIEKYKPTRIMSDHDSTFTSSQFKEILNKYDMIQNLNIKDDHHALGLVDSFARTLKKTFTRIFLSNGNSNWIKHIDEIIDNFNKMPNSAINDITPNDAFKEKNHRTIYDINYEKSLKNNTVSDIDVNDKVRILIKKQFQKGTESRYSDEVYTVKKVNGKSITLNNDEVYKRSSLLIVPKSTISDEKNIIVKINKQIKEERFLKSEGVDVSNILKTSARRGAAASAADAGKPAPLARMTKRGKNKLLEALK